MNLSDLEKPFPPSAISWRVGATNADKTSGIALAYIDARDVMERLDNVCGPENWQAIYSDAGNGKTCCQIGIYIEPKITGTSSMTSVLQSSPMWVWKANGAGETDFEADKGAFSDAFKRAAVLWGIGRYLYGIETPWVGIVQRGKSYAINPDEVKKLDAIMDKISKAYIPRDQKAEFYKQIKECLARGDEHGIRELWAEWDTDQKIVLWPMFNPQERSAMKAMKAAG